MLPALFPARCRTLLIGASLALLALIRGGHAQTCTEWTLTSTPGIGGAHGLGSVAALGSDVAWAVGGAGIGSPIALRFSAGTWQQVQLPSVSSLGTQPELTSAAIASNGDAWVFGKVTTTYPTYQMPLALRQRSGSWDRVETMTLRPQTEYPYAARGGTIDAAFAAAPNDIWAVGSAVGFGDGGATSVSLAAHFNGSSWVDVPTPILSNRTHYMRDVHGSASNNVWAVGYTRSIAMPYYARTYRWNGSSWQHIPNPAESIPDSFLYSVHVISPDDVWASGSINYSTPLMMHYDGSAWSIVNLPPDMPSTGIRGLTASAPDRVWATVGSDSRVLLYDGAQWSLIQGPPVPGGASYRVINEMFAVADCDVWAVGTAYTDNIGAAYVARLGTGAVMGDITGDGQVNVNDLLSVINSWGVCPTPPAACPADISPALSGDGVVNVNDLLMVINNWG